MSQSTRRRCEAATSRKEENAERMPTRNTLLRSVNNLRAKKEKHAKAKGKTSHILERNPNTSAKPQAAAQGKLFFVANVVAQISAKQPNATTRGSGMAVRV